MKKLISFMIVLVMLGCSSAFADFDYLSDEQLVNLIDRAQKELGRRQAEKEGSLFEADIDGCHVVLQKLSLSPEDSDVLLVHYSLTNPTSKSKGFYSVLHTNVYQDGIELDSNYTAEGVDTDNWVKDIINGATVEAVMGYELRNKESVIEIHFKSLFDNPIVEVFAVPKE